MAQRSHYTPLLRRPDAPLPPVFDQPLPPLKPVLEPEAQTATAPAARSALDGANEKPDPQTVPAPVPANPLAAPGRFDALFLKPESIDTYLNFAASSKEDANFLVASALKNWKADKDKIPLELCEYLAYKSVLAYEDEASLRAHFKGGGWRGMEADSFEFFDTGKNGDTQGFGFVSGKTAFIAMRGTTSVEDWFTDLSPALTTDEDIPAETRKLIGSVAPRRHLGFASAWGHAAPKIEDWAEKVRKNHGAEEFCFTGHSLGGALALVGAHDFAKRNVAKVGGVITFAAPKVGGPEFAADYAQLGLSERTLRCESGEDLVTWAARHSDFENPGVSCLVDKRPMIAGIEVFWAAILGIAGWEKAKAAAQSAPGSEKKPDSAKKPELCQETRRRQEARRGQEARRERETRGQAGTERTSWGFQERYWCHSRGCSGGRGFLHRPAHHYPLSRARRWQTLFAVFLDPRLSQNPRSAHCRPDQSDRRGACRRHQGFRNAPQIHARQRSRREILQRAQQPADPGVVAKTGARPVQKDARN